MTDSHTEDSAVISVAIKKLATRKELGKSEKRLGTATEALRKEILDEMGDRDERLRKEMKSHTLDAVCAGAMILIILNLIGAIILIS